MQIFLDSLRVARNTLLSGTSHSATKEGKMTTNTDLDSIDALDRADVEAAIEGLRDRVAWAGGAGHGWVRTDALARVADALAEHLIDRGDA